MVEEILLIPEEVLVTHRQQVHHKEITVVQELIPLQLMALVEEVAQVQLDKMVVHQKVEMVEQEFQVQLQEHQLLEQVVVEDLQ